MTGSIPCLSAAESRPTDLTFGAMVWKVSMVSYKLNRTASQQRSCFNNHLEAVIATQLVGALSNPLPSQLS
ncbi:hypothetical protein PsAD14_01493 [Pseudovibrio sp. Ad14]|nr:hypothetical protein PsW74_04836 [Pseudovibrio sp. W74]KZL09969.1 hypothetical protein PsAD14_01493 [Pseudovibrio sp. Ad14]